MFIGQIFEVKAYSSSLKEYILDMDSIGSVYWQPEELLILKNKNGENKV